MRRNVLLTLALGGIMALAAPTARADRPIELKDMPKAVQATVAARSKGATIHGLYESRDGGKLGYEMELVMGDGHRKDMDIAADGSLGEVEEQVALAKVPKVPRAAIVRTAGKRRIERVEAVSKGDGPVFCYEVGVKDGSRYAEFRVDTAGKPAPDDEDD